MESRKKILILAGTGVLALLVIGVIIAGMFTSEQTETNQPLSVEEGTHIGVDKILSQKQVNEALGDLGRDAKRASLSGTVNTDDLRGETASYAFTTLEGKQAVIDIEARIFPSAEAMKEDEPFRETEEKELKDIDADEAHYFLPRPYSADHQVALIATKGNTIYKFSVMQNANDGVDINQRAAKRIVLRLAQTANFDAVK